MKEEKKQIIIGRSIVNTLRYSKTRVEDARKRKKLKLKKIDENINKKNYPILNKNFNTKNYIKILSQVIVQPHRGYNNYLYFRLFNTGLADLNYLNIATYSYYDQRFQKKVFYVQKLICKNLHKDAINNKHQIKKNYKLIYNNKN